MIERDEASLRMVVPPPRTVRITLQTSERMSPLPLHDAQGGIGTIVPWRCRERTDAWCRIKPVAVIVARIGARIVAGIVARAGRRSHNVAARDVTRVRIVKTCRAGFDLLSHRRSDQYRGDNQSEG